MGSNGYGDYQFYNPYGICLSYNKGSGAGSQMIYIADYDNHRIVCYETDCLDQRSTTMLIPEKGEIKFVREFPLTPGLFLTQPM